MRRLRPGEGGPPETSTVVSRTTVRILNPVIVAMSVFFLFRGHNAPGGGFIAGLVAGSVIVLRYLTNGTEGVRHLLPFEAETLLGAGLLVAASTGLVALVAGGQFLESAIWHWEAPVLGELEVATSLFFDIGVYCIVIGTVLAVVRHLGREEL